MKKILYIEDNYYNILLVKKILTNNNYDFYEAKSGLEGIEKALDVLPDLILMDINLPELSGLEVTTKIRSLPELKEVKIIALTAEVSEGSKEKAIAAGCNGYISKPIDHTFLNKLEQYIEGKKDILENKEEEIKILKEYSTTLVDKLEEKIRKLTSANEELEKAYKSIQSVNKKLLLLNKMEENFISISSHELRTPLVVVKGFIDLSVDGAFGDLQPKLKDTLSICQNNIEKLMSIVDDITDFSKLKYSSIDIVISQISIKNIFDELLKEYKSIFDIRNLNFEIINNAYSELMNAEKNFIYQALQNFVSNAIKNTPDGGDIKLGIEENEDYFTFFVTDTGVGIEEQYLNKIFDKFFVIGDSSHHFSGNYEFQAGGKGLGLAITKNIAKIHNGKVWVESIGKGHGSSFFMQIPKNFENDIKSKMNISDKEKYIMTINCPNLHDVLKSELFQVENMELENVPKDLKKVRTPQVMIFDISGLELEKVVETLNRFKNSEIFLYIPIIIIDEEDDSIKKAEIFSMGIEEYLVKPLDSDYILNIIKMLV